jgi:hypothetical protein
MCIKKMGPAAMGLVLVGLLAGCGKSESASFSPGSAPNQQVQNDPVLSLHWAGMKRLSVEPSAAGFMRIWRLPETEKLKARTLDKLALAPWQAPGTNQTRIITNYAALVQQNHAASLLRPLLEGRGPGECYLEIRDAQAAPTQVAVAIHLDAKRAAAWETDLAGVFGSNSNPPSKGASGGTNVGWQIQYTNKLAAKPVVKQAQLARFGDWIVVGFGPIQNAAFTELLTRAQHNQFSSPAAATKDWLQTTFDLRRSPRRWTATWICPKNGRVLH